MPLPRVQEGERWLIYPINPLSRWLHWNNLYLESGVYRFCTAFLNPDCYKPAVWHYSTPYSRYLGPLTVLENSAGAVQLDASPGVKSGKQRESRSLGCDTKYRDVVMYNPTWGFSGLNSRAYKYENVYLTPSALGPAGLVPAITPLKEEFVVRGDSVNPAGYGSGGDVEKLAVSQTEDFCENSIIEKKWAQQRLPPSMWSGKMRLFMQAVYGALDYPYRLRGGDVELTHSNGVTSALKPHNGITTILYTDSQLRYYLFRVSALTVSVNKLVVSAEAEWLRRYLLQTPVTDSGALRELEAYMLATARLTIWLPVPNGRAAVTRTLGMGGPRYWSWNANWKGSEWVMATYRQETIEQHGRQVHIGSLHKISITESGLDALHTAWDNCVTCWETHGYEPTEEEVAATEACQMCDIEPPTEDEEDPYYGLPWSEDFYQRMVNCFAFQYELVEGEKEYQLPIQAVKTWVWDDLYALYRWDQPYNPFRGGVVFPDCDVPIYAWFDSTDTITVLRYTFTQEADADDVDIPLEQTCGATRGYQCSIRKSGVQRYGFYVGTLQLNTQPSAHVSTTYFDYQLTSVEEDSEWSRTAQTNPCGAACFGKYPPLISGCYNDNLSTTKYWIKKTIGRGESLTFAVDGHQAVATAVVFPKTNCEALGLIQQATASGQATRFRQTVSATLSCQTSPFCFWNCMEVRYRGGRSGLVSYNSCATLETGDWIIWGPQFTGAGGLHTDDCIARPNAFCGPHEGIVSTTRHDTRAPVAGTTLDSGLFNAVEWQFSAYVVHKNGHELLAHEKGNNTINFVEGCEFNAFAGGTEKSLGEKQAKVRKLREFVATVPLLWPYTDADFNAYQMTGGPWEVITNFGQHYSNPPAATWPWGDAHYYYCGSV